MGRNFYLLFTCFRAKISEEKTVFRKKMEIYWLKTNIFPVFFFLRRLPLLSFGKESSYDKMLVVFLHLVEESTLCAGGAHDRLYWDILPVRACAACMSKNGKKWFRECRIHKKSHFRFWFLKHSTMCHKYLGGEVKKSVTFWKLFYSKLINED